ncbi:Uncharacterised protein [Enterococcus durans]|uniref:Uncharacterized protein n=1 Tax=Enterococcus durans ATCC 6056 TaxID=1140001 RepID=A0ABN0KQR3_9ENTE|nr:hypothetical protein OMS_00867 [Enterococcus durans ATCC 6056]EOU19615.1 hypothetical protein I571_02619 [Enterococcus durans ATCC 6056]STP38596.1 Uncharacterised protein [Enterococcus durans]
MYNFCSGCSTLSDSTKSVGAEATPRNKPKFSELNTSVPILLQILF